MRRAAIQDDLVSLTLALGREIEPEAVIREVLAAAIRLANADSAEIFTLDSLARQLHLLAALDPACTLAHTTHIAIYGPELTPNLRDPAAFAVTTGKIVNLGSVDAATGFDLGGRRGAGDAGSEGRSLMLLPLIVQRSQTMGVLQLHNVRQHAGAAPGALPEELLRPMESLAAHAAMAIRNSLLARSHDQMVENLGRLRIVPTRDNLRLLLPVRAPVRPAGLIGQSPPIERVFRLIERAAAASVPILLRGETGTGKEVLAAYVHASSPRAGRPFVAQNCAALPEALLESELFGHVKGAFTGAATDKAGLVQSADGGTLFLDEIGDMPVSLQAKVLRLLQDGEVRPVGAIRAAKVDVRIVAATNVDLEEMILSGRFRKDLFYRLNVFPITVPPLRERPSDIPRFIDHFVARANAMAGRPAPGLAPEALELLMRWSYPGNVRELRNIVERAMLLADDGECIDVRHLPPELAGAGRRQASEPIPDEALKHIMARHEAFIIEAKLREAKWNQSHAARALKISRRTIVQKIGRYGIRRRRDEPL